MKQVACGECHLHFDTLLSKASYNSVLSASTRGANVLETREGALIFIDVLVTFFMNLQVCPVTNCPLKDTVDSFLTLTDIVN